MSEREPARQTHQGAAPFPTVAIATDDERVVEEVRGRFPSDEQDKIRAYEDPRDILQNDTAIPADVTLVTHTVMKNLARHHLEALNEFCRRQRVILLVRSNEFLDSVAFLEMADGVVFLDATIDRLPDVVVLAGAGYSILPSAAAMDIVTDRLRCDTIKRLTPLELSILDQIRLAKTNRAIARTLGLTEANVKTKVRAILKALKFQNRTEAAVFAARQHETIRQAIAERAQEQVVMGEGEEGRSDREGPGLTAH